MEGRKQKAKSSKQQPITKDAWVDLSRKLLARTRDGFNADERATVAGFINYVAPDVETVQEGEKQWK